MVSVAAEVVVAAIRPLAIVGLLAGASACNAGGLLVGEPRLDETDTVDSSEGLDADASEGLVDEGLVDEGLVDEGAEGGEVILVAPGDPWRFMTGSSIDPQWASPGFDDAAWSVGAAPLGHGLSVVTTIAANHPTAWFRTSFELGDPSSILGLDLRLRRDDGAIAYLNGVEILRTNMGGGPIGPTSLAASESHGLDAYRYQRGFAPVELLQVGTNVLAVEIHDEVSQPEDRVIDALLQVVDPALVPTELEFRVRTIGYDGKYGPRNVGAIWIERADGTFVRTLEVWGDVRREHLIAWRTSSSENDVDAITSSTSAKPTTRFVSWDLSDLAGQPVPPGDYRIRVEYTEDDSNEGAAAGPTIAVDFELGGATDRIETPTAGNASAFADLLLWGP